MSDNTLIDAVVAVALADESLWAQFRRLAGTITHHESDYAAETFLRDWFCPSWKDVQGFRAADGWAQTFILNFFTEAAAGHCSVTGFVGLTEVEIPPAIFTSIRLVNDRFVEGKGFYYNEISLPDGTLVVAVRVSWIEPMVHQEPKPKPLKPEDGPPAPPRKKLTEAQWQALYDAQCTADHAPTTDDDQDFAHRHGTTQKHVAKLRARNPHPLLHTRGPRRKK